MELSNIKIGFALTGSHCSFDKVIPQIEELKNQGAEIFPIISSSVDNIDTRFGESIEWKKKLVDITGKKLINSIVSAEPIGPGNLVDILTIAPCTGNTVAKLANGITDSIVTMAAKAHLRNDKPVVIAMSTNDALGLNAKNIGILINTKNIFFVPFSQDAPHKKPNSLVSHMGLIIPTIKNALTKSQLQPLIQT